MKKAKKTKIPKEELEVFSDLESIINPMATLHFLITFSLGCHRYEIDPTFYDNHLKRYTQLMRRCGYGRKNINSRISRTMMKIKLGGESYRVVTSYKI